MNFVIYLQATNGAGLESWASTSAVILDSTQPVAGFILDGLGDVNGKDEDFQVRPKTYFLVKQRKNVPINVIMLFSPPVSMMVPVINNKK